MPCSVACLDTTDTARGNVANVVLLVNPSSYMPGGLNCSKCSTELARAGRSVPAKPRAHLCATVANSFKR